MVLQYLWLLHAHIVVGNHRSTQFTHFGVQQLVTTHVVQFHIMCASKKVLARCVSVVVLCLM